MSGTDSGIETGSESNGSTSMSVGSPPSLNMDNLQDHAEPQDEEVGDAVAPFFRSVQPLAVQCLGAMATESSASLLGHDGGMEDRQPYSSHFWHGKMRMQQRRARRWRNLSANCATFRNIIGERKLRIAAITNQIPLVRRLLETGVNPCAADERSRTALHFAACKGHLEIIKMLLEHGANPNQRDIVGNTPLHLAVCTSHTEVITHLLKAGTDVNSLDNSGRTPLHLAQSKLRVLKVDVAKSSENVKQEVMNVIEMLQVYLQRSGKPAESDLLGAFSTRLRLHQTRQEVDNDVQDLLSSLAHLSLHKT
ncbi:ankyrin repeat domain-containing protein 54 isoform X2 [Rhipicephalus sanguineus]|uniref:ankyrin repeat domain-containing protein 54 isoform X2 n=1 Tax=Rhipicephalus sanguineus TaxID=34632 RepID=UPI001893ED15|nr:ankyrin repeat domain-containing protein 54 isoform X2 [Rhipicephalus sanguineus]